ncbi:hypothetical protein [Deinococcus misasensis]|uniref:hypothetical protein n=1 Tax=Deinococcus misasensis TaxID=392413 RepID=UPI0012FC75DF|nr:hypothetical protein [Deinococcus misasensis]
MTMNAEPQRKTRKPHTIKTKDPISLTKADHYNFNALVKTLAYCTFWMTSDLKNERGHWQIQYKSAWEYISDHPDDPENMLLVVETSLEIRGLDAQYLRGEFLKLSPDFQVAIQTYLDRKPRAVKPSKTYAEERWLKWILDPEQAEATNAKRAAAGLPPMTKQERDALIGKITVEMHHPTKLTNQSRANRNMLGDQKNWMDTPFFVEPPDLLDHKYAPQLLAWRQLLYKVLWACTLEIHTTQRQKPKPEPTPEDTTEPQTN